MSKIHLRILEALSHAWVLALVIVLSVAILLDLSPVGGNYRMYAAWVRCGHKPVMGSEFIGVKDYNTPPFYDPVRLDVREYFCTPEEAEAAGYESPILFREDNAEQVDERQYVP